MDGAADDGGRQSMIKMSHGINAKAKVPPWETYESTGPFSSPPPQSLLMGRGKPFSAIWFLQKSGSKLLGTGILSRVVKNEHMTVYTQPALLVLNAIIKIAQTWLYDNVSSNLSHRV